MPFLGGQTQVLDPVLSGKLGGRGGDESLIFRRSESRFLVRPWTLRGAGCLWFGESVRQAQTAIPKRRIAKLQLAHQTQLPRSCRRSKPGERYLAGCRPPRPRSSLNRNHDEGVPKVHFHSQNRPEKQRGVGGKYQEPPAPLRPPLSG